MKNQNYFLKLITTAKAIITHMIHANTASCGSLKNIQKELNEATNSFIKSTILCKNHIYMKNQNNHRKASQ